MRMKKTLIGLLALVMVSGFVALAQAANPETVIVRVTITTAMGIELVSGGLIDFGPMDAGADAVVVSSSTVIRNDGTGASQTYKMSADHLAGDWTAGSEATHNTYVLQAAFHGDQPAAGDFDAKDNILVEDTDKFASDTALTIDATQTGANVAWDESRSIWYKFQPPSSSSVTGPQDITVTITATP